MDSCARRPDRRRHLALIVGIAVLLAGCGGGAGNADQLATTGSDRVTASGEVGQAVVPASRLSADSATFTQALSNLETCTVASCVRREIDATAQSASTFNTDLDASFNVRAFPQCMRGFRTAASGVLLAGAQLNSLKPYGDSELLARAATPAIRDANDQARQEAAQALTCASAQAPRGQGAPPTSLQACADLWNAPGNSLRQIMVKGSNITPQAWVGFFPDLPGKCAIILTVGSSFQAWTQADPYSETFIDGRSASGPQAALASRLTWNARATSTGLVSVDADAKDPTTAPTATTNPTPPPQTISTSPPPPAQSQANVMAGWERTASALSAADSKMSQLVESIAFDLISGQPDALNAYKEATGVYDALLTTAVAQLDAGRSTLTSSCARQASSYIRAAAAVKAAEARIISNPTPDSTDGPLLQSSNTIYSALSRAEHRFITATRSLRRACITDSAGPATTEPASPAASPTTSNPAIAPPPTLVDVTPPPGPSYNFHTEHVNCELYFGAHGTAIDCSSPHRAASLLWTGAVTFPNPSSSGVPGRNVPAGTGLAIHSPSEHLVYVCIASGPAMTCTLSENGPGFFVGERFAFEVSAAQTQQVSPSQAPPAGAAPPLAGDVLKPSGYWCPTNRTCFAKGVTWTRYDASRAVGRGFAKSCAPGGVDCAAGNWSIVLTAPKASCGKLRYTRLRMQGSDFEFSCVAQTYLAAASAPTASPPPTYARTFASVDGRQQCYANDSYATCTSSVSGQTVSVRVGGVASYDGDSSAAGAGTRMPEGTSFTTQRGLISCESGSFGIHCTDKTQTGTGFYLGDRYGRIINGGKERRV
jgi:hypothetical protein